MKRLIFIVGGLILFYSCQNKGDDNQKDSENIMTVDSLPDAEWNGEYMKIKDIDEPKINRKSIGSEYSNLGKVTLKIGDKEVTYSNFIQNKTVLSFTKKSITAFITNDQNDQIQLYFKKEDMGASYKGKYKPDPEGNSNSSVIMRITSNGVSEKEAYILQSGVAEIIDFSPQLASLVVNIKGVFTDLEGTERKGEGEIKMNFENAVMTAN